jgi:hypothetical protein
MTRLKRNRGVKVLGVGAAMTCVLVGGAAAPVITASAVPMRTTAAVPMRTAADPPSAAHPFSDPIYSPLRVPARVNCVRTNCPGPYHGYWAIDFISSLREPAFGRSHDVLYAAGAGVFHIGDVDTRCRTTATAGTWVWIDHGGGRTTQYSHLNDVLAREGQLVTPATRIGTIGHSGYVCTGLNYLHMEYRVGGITGTRVPPEIMLACVGNRRVSMPSEGLGRAYAEWNLVPTNQNPRTGLKPNVFTPQATNQCLATSRGAATPNRPAVTGGGGTASAMISWGAVPAGVDHTIVTIDRWLPSLGRWSQSADRYRTVAGRVSSTRFTGLRSGKLYRLRATTHNGAGYSAWSEYVKVTPAAP